MAGGGKSSRIIIKNLPKSIADDRIREHFAQKGEITDVQLKFTQYVRVICVVISQALCVAVSSSVAYGWYAIGCC